MGLLYCRLLGEVNKQVFEKRFVAVVEWLFVPPQV